MICPAVKFAASLIPKTMGLDVLLAISMIIKRGDKTRGAPGCIKELKNKTL